MDDLSEKLAGILNDPESMERVRKMAESLLSGNENETEAKPPENQSDFPFGSDEISTFIAIANRLKSSEETSETALLKALKPNLSEPRQRKVDTAVKLLKIIEILPLVKETGLLNL